jgi:predicted transcriptional regulator
MMVHLKPEQQAVLDRAAQSGMSPEELLDQAFAVIDEQQKNGGWMLAEREAIAAHISEGFAEAERGELVDPDEARRILRERRSNRPPAR